MHDRQGVRRYVHLEGLHVPRRSWVRLQRYRGPRRLQGRHPTTRLHASSVTYQRPSVIGATQAPRGNVHCGALCSKLRWREFVRNTDVTYTTATQSRTCMWRRTVVVKTLADPNASTVNLSAVTRTSIQELNALPQHCDGGPDRRTYAEEFRVFEVVGKVTYIAH